MALYAIAVPVRNVNRSGVRTLLATGGHVTFLPYCVSPFSELSYPNWNYRYSTVTYRSFNSGGLFACYGKTSKTHDVESVESIKSVESHTHRITWLQICASVAKS